MWSELGLHFSKSLQPFHFLQHFPGTRLLMPVIKIKLKSLDTAAFWFCVSCCKGPMIQHQPTHPAARKVTQRRRTPFFSERKFYDSWFARSFLMLFLLLSHNPISFLCPSDDECVFVCGWLCCVVTCTSEIFSFEKVVLSRSCHGKKWNLFERWKSRPPHNCQAKAPKLKKETSRRDEMPCAEH